MKLKDEHGVEIDANISRDGKQFTVNARGPGLNTQYSQGLRELLRRLMAQPRLHILNVQVVSRKAMAMPADERVLMARVVPSERTGDHWNEVLAARIQRASSKHARPPGAKGSGNNTKRIQIRVSGISEARLVALFPEEASS